MQTVSVTYSTQELEALLRIFDLATKSGGLAVARDVVFLHNKLLQAVQNANEQGAPKTEA
jgi:hypothetical protein